MEKLLAKKGIEFLSYTDEEGTQISYAFTNNMLKQGIIVVLSEWQYEPGEGEEESEEWEEAVETDGDEQAAWEEDTEDSELTPPTLFETAVSVILTKGDVSYEFGIYANDEAAVPVIYLYRVILDLVDIISGSDAESMLEVLESVSLTVSSSNDFGDDPEMRNEVYNLTVEHLENAARLVAER